MNQLRHLSCHSPAAFISGHLPSLELVRDERNEEIHPPSDRPVWSPSGGPFVPFPRDTCLLREPSSNTISAKKKKKVGTRSERGTLMIPLALCPLLGPPSNSIQNQILVREYIQSRSQNSPKFSGLLRPHPARTQKPLSPHPHPPPKKNKDAKDWNSTRFIL